MSALETQTELWLHAHAPLCLPAYRLVRDLQLTELHVNAATELMPSARGEEGRKMFRELLWYARASYASCLGAEVDRADDEIEHARTALTATGVTDSQVRLVEDRIATAQARRDRLMQLAHEVLR